MSIILKTYLELITLRFELGSFPVNIKSYELTRLSIIVLVVSATMFEYYVGPKYTV